ncbi:hypothetical protein EVAR_19556_1 [Eumeta japonica]|uniref:Uncharacterized protein n=1 Tax=Eumeta variegata TaxID=151549 RepID=A0A4C1UGJ2_EUMVA|nr:hypothetical protein EVAR_19556_1 [Eumeta japonica]
MTLTSYNKLIIRRPLNNGKQEDCSSSKIGCYRQSLGPAADAAPRRRRAGAGRYRFYRRDLLREVSPHKLNINAAESKENPDQSRRLRGADPRTTPPRTARAARAARAAPGPNTVYYTKSV